MLTLTPEEAALMNQMGTPLETSLAEGIDGSPYETIPAIPGYTSLTGSQKTLAKGALKTAIAAFISALKGAPAYGEITFLGGWGPWGDTAFSQGTVQYHKNVLGEVIIQGLVKSPIPTASGTVIGSVPAGYRPAPGQARIFPCLNGAGTFNQVSINSNGNIIVRDTSASNTYLILNLRFQAA